MDKYKVLKQYFGYDGFRPGQESIIDAILSGRDAFGIMPTGGGKSICYQIPALMLPGVTFVVSPLISLMTDQVMQLKESGVPAAYINSTLTASQLNTVYRNLYSGMYKIIYVAPERLETEEFRYASGNLDISLFAVDEAHCISQWGQDFRPSYLKIPEFLATLGKRPIVSAFTATATEKVRSDIENLLGLISPEKVITSFDRPNFYFDVLKPKNKFKAALSLVKERNGKSGIIYCATRSKVETVCEKLCDEGISATRYHAGLEDSERSANQEDFLYDKKSVMVATNAFGMGINKSNVNYVIHYNMPKSLEEYYQEAGRAGRDGENADCILMYGVSDIITAKFLVGNGTEMQDSELWEMYPKEMERLKAMTEYCENTGCYRGKILDYFGEEHEETCGNCGECKGEFETCDVTVEAQKILSCIERIYRKKGFYLGKTMVVGTLRGRRSERILDYGLNTLPVYGIMKDDSHEYVEKIFDHLCKIGYIITDGEYKTARPSMLSQYVLKGEEKVLMTFKKQSEAEKIEKKSERRKKKKASQTEVNVSTDLFEILRKLRLEIATEEKQPPFVIFHDSTLRDMVAKKPKNHNELLEVSGIGERKAKKYGEAFLSAITEYVEKETAVSPTKTDDAVTDEKKTKKEYMSYIDPCETDRLKRKAAMDMDSLWKSKENAMDEGTFEKDNSELLSTDAVKAQRNENHKDRDSFSTVLYEAYRFLSEQPDRSPEGVPPKVTSMLTYGGRIYNTVSFEKGTKLSSDERRVLSLMTREYDTRVIQMVTLWKDGSVYGTSPNLLSRLFELDRANRNTQVLVAVNPRTKYDGRYEPNEFKTIQLKELIQE